jgi:DNA helicase-4
MGFIADYFQNRREKIRKRNILCNELIGEIDTAIFEIDCFFENKFEYVDAEQGNLLFDKWSYLKEKSTPFSIKPLLKALSFKQLTSSITVFLQKVNSIPLMIANHNNTVAYTQIENAYNLIGNIEGQKLDDQQMLCVIKKAHNHLVIAGAGTGKTTTIVGKIKYLLKSNLCNSREILVLSFTNTSATEMRERIHKETGEEIEASTFHKLGLSIIAKYDGIIPKITQISLHKFIKEKLNEYMQQPEYLNILASYLLYNKVVAKSEFEFKSKSEYEEYLQLNPPMTLKNENVKSYGEMDIANFLSQNGISYIYECPYPLDTRTDEYSQYQPDFYIPDFDIYIEYFGINKSGEVPSYFSSKNGKTATQNYQESMHWKRTLHKGNQTTLIECFAYEKSAGILLQNLEQQLIKCGVILYPKSPNELWNEILESENSVLDGLVELFGTVINLIKSNNISIEDLKSINIQRDTNTHTNSQIISLVEPLFVEYDQQLKANNEIDFNDMINVATRYVAEHKIIHNYKYVIVDEYQDISKARYLLLKEMRKNKDYDLFCVGDDWQSIYRFAGSDIGFILNFGHYWGSTENSKIETTYRFSQKLIEVSGNFIMRNSMQIKKSIRGETAETRFVIGEVCGYTEKYAVEFMRNKILDFPQNSTVFFIGRYSFDAKILSDSGLFKCQYNNSSGIVDVVSDKRKDLKMEFITAHKSKGLQADFVIIINNKRSRMGFPSKIQDASILHLLIDDCDNYLFAEERRLFYVALTRAKRKAILLTVSGNESEFVLELKSQYEVEIKKEAFECPICGGYLSKKSGPYGEFIGCSNYKSIGCTYNRKIKL